MNSELLSGKLLVANVIYLWGAGMVICLERGAD